MRSKKPLAERFWSKVNKQGPILITKLGRCWEYTGALSNGYGSICVIEEDGTHRSEVTHRVAWFLATGTWPSEHILHKCDNKKCVRRSHHFEGTHGDNMRDMISKGKGPIGENALHKCDTGLCVRFSHLINGTQAENMHDRVLKQTHCKRGHSLETAYIQPNGARSCRLCRKERGE